MPHSSGEPCLPLTRTTPTAPGKSSKPSAKRKSDALDDDDDEEAPTAKKAKMTGASVKAAAESMTHETPSSFKCSVPTDKDVVRFDPKQCP